MIIIVLYKITAKNRHSKQHQYFSHDDTDKKKKKPTPKGMSNKRSTPNIPHEQK